MLRRIFAIVAMLAIAVLTLRARVEMDAGIDYEHDASDAIDAVVRGDWAGYAANQPLMGSFSVLLRAPFVALNFHGNVTTIYYLGVLPCLVALIALGVVLGRRLAANGADTLTVWIAGALVVVNPLTIRAIHWGHPEELLGAALCVGAVLAVLDGRDVLGAVLLGLALATKQWAVIAIAPVLLAGPRRPVLLALCAGAIAAAFTLPLWLANAGQFGTVVEGAAGQLGQARLTTPWNIWWPLTDLGGSPALGERWLSPAWVTAISHPLAVLAGLVVAAAFWRRRDRRPEDALLLLAIALLLRCVLDSWNNEYYHLPFVAALIAWEVVHRRDLPYLSLGVALAAGLTFLPTMESMFKESTEHAAISFIVYTAWALPLLAGLTLQLLRPDVLARLAARLPKLAPAKRLA